MSPPGPLYPPPDSLYSPPVGPPPMAARRAVGDPARGHRRRRANGRLVAGILVLLLVAAVGVVIGRRIASGGWTFAADGCVERGSLRLAVAPEIAPLLERAAKDVDANCSILDISPLEPGQTAAVVAGGRVDGWVPASSAWLHLSDSVPPPSGPATAPSGPATAPASPATAPADAAQGEPGRSADQPVSLVRTPVVIAAPKPLAESLGWPQRQAGWAELTAATITGKIPRLSMDSPLHSAAGLLGVLGVHTAMSRTTPDQGIAQLRALTLRSRLADADADPTALLRLFAAQTDPASAVRNVGVFPVTEQALWTYLTDRPTIPLAAIYPGDGLMEADYPLVLTRAAAADRQHTELAARLVERIHSDQFTATILEHGFRPAVGTSATPSADGLLAQYPAPSTVPVDSKVVTERALQWAKYERLTYQTLILIDASGSMNDPVRTRSGAVTTKAGLLRAAGQQAAQLFGLDTSLGIWLFATPTPTSPPYVPVVPLGPLDEPLGAATRRAVVQSLAAGYTAHARAGTPLYATVLASVAEMKKLVRPGTVTMVVVLTDGRDEDALQYAMPRQDFLSRLASVRDPGRPVPVFSIGYGADADMAALNEIAKITGGRAVASNDPGDLASAMAQIFLAAHAVR